MRMLMEGRQYGESQHPGIRYLHRRSESDESAWYRILECQGDSCEWGDHPSMYMQSRRWYPTLEVSKTTFTCHNYRDTNFSPLNNQPLQDGSAIIVCPSRCPSPVPLQEANPLRPVFTARWMRVGRLCQLRQHGFHAEQPYIRVLPA